MTANSNSLLSAKICFHKYLIVILFTIVACRALPRDEFIIGDSIPWIELQDKIYNTTNVYIFQSCITKKMDIEKSQFNDTSRLSLSRTEYEGKSRYGFRKIKFKNNSSFELVGINLNQLYIDMDFAVFSMNSVMSLFDFKAYNNFVLSANYSKFNNSFLTICRMKLFDRVVLSCSKSLFEKKSNITVMDLKTIYSMIYFDSSKIYDSTRLSVSNTSFNDTSFFSCIGAVFSNYAFAHLTNIVCSGSIIRFSKASFVNNSSLSLNNIVFSGNSKLQLSGLHISDNSELRVDSVLISGDTVTFKDAKLFGKTTFIRSSFPEYVDFRYVQIGDRNVDLSWVRSSENKKIKIALWGSAIEKINLNTNFRLWFPGTLTTEEKKDVYSRVLSKYKQEKNDFMFKYFQNEYATFLKQCV